MKRDGHSQRVADSVLAGARTVGFVAELDDYGLDEEADVYVVRLRIEGEEDLLELRVDREAAILGANR